MNKSDGWVAFQSKYLFMPEFNETGLVKHGLSLKALGNMSLAVEQEISEDVLIRRQELAQLIGIDHHQIVRGYQTHSNNIHLVKESAPALTLAGNGQDVIPDTDGLITNIPGIPLSIFVADCVPIFLLDRANKAIGLVHAGWRGTIAKIAQKAVYQMQEAFNATPSDLLIGIGPCIGSCCYKVGPEVIEAVKENFIDYEGLIKGNFFNLAFANKQQVLEAGINEKNIILSQRCTACSPHEFFSYRMGNKGRMMAVIELRECCV